jgi:hypothetical protein
MNEQMKNQRKLDKFFSPINLSCTKNELLQQYFKTFGKIQLLIH